jgi:hypothetical protein
MRRISIVLLVLVLAAGAVPARQEAEFTWVDVVLDTGGEHLGAWQVELTDARGAARVAGVEGGEHPAFAAPPYYDPRALQQGRIVLAAFQTQGELPAGRVRVARVHVRVEAGAEPAFEARLVAAADGAGREIPARVELEH